MGEIARAALFRAELVVLKKDQSFSFCSMCLVPMDEERGRLRSLLPLVVGVGGLGLAVAMIVDGVQKNAAAARLKQSVDETETGEEDTEAGDTLEGTLEDTEAGEEEDTEAGEEEDTEAGEEEALPAPPAPPAPASSKPPKPSKPSKPQKPQKPPAPASPKPLSEVDKRSLYRQAYEKARRRTPVDPRATAVARLQSA